MSYRKCLYCEANLDPNELCDCSESRAAQKKTAPEAGTPKAAKAMIAPTLYGAQPDKSRGEEMQWHGSTQMTLWPMPNGIRRP